MGCVRVDCGVSVRCGEGEGEVGMRVNCGESVRLGRCEDGVGTEELTVSHTSTVVSATFFSECNQPRNPRNPLCQHTPLQ